MLYTKRIENNVSLTIFFDVGKKIVNIKKKANINVDKSSKQKDFFKEIAFIQPYLMMKLKNFNPF